MSAHPNKVKLEQLSEYLYLLHNVDSEMYLKEKFHTLIEENTLYYNLSLRDSQNFPYRRKTVLNRLLNLYENFLYDQTFKDSKFSKILLQFIHQNLSLAGSRTSYPYLNKQFKHITHKETLPQCITSHPYMKAVNRAKALPEIYRAIGGGSREKQVSSIKSLVKELEKSPNHGSIKTEFKLISGLANIWKSIPDFGSLFKGSVLKSQLGSLLKNYFKLHSTEDNKVLSNCILTFKQKNTLPILGNASIEKHAHELKGCVFNKGI